MGCFVHDGDGKNRAAQPKPVGQAQTKSNSRREDFSATGICTHVAPSPGSLFTFLFVSPSVSVNFLYNSFNASDASYLELINDARVEGSVIRLTNDSNQFSFGRVFYPTRLTMKPTSNSTAVASFSTSFVFSILPDISDSPGFGLAFVLSNSTSPPGALASQYFGLFSNATVPSVAPLLAVEFDTGQNPEFNDIDDGGYYNSSGDFVAVEMRNGQNIRAWIEFDGPQFEINVTIAPVAVSKPSRPLISYRNPKIANYVSTEMYVGFSASKTNWVEAQRILAWSLSDTGVAADINTTNLPTKIEEEDEIEDWELEYWPHRFSYEELKQATDGFSKNELLGWPQSVDLRQPQDATGLGRAAKSPRRRCRGLNYLHQGWDKVVIHRDIKSSNILLDSEMRGRLGDFGLAKLYEHGAAPNTTRVVGTLGYLAPELATVTAPTAASDVYSFGVVVLEVACGRRPIETWAAEEEQVLIDWVREKYLDGRVYEAADKRIAGQYVVEEMERVLKLGLACCHPDPQHRPTMKEVVTVLVGEEAAAAPAAVLSELAQAGESVGCSGGDTNAEEPPLQSTV
ncbi:L-type lectin-domain containing receptor kinase S.1 [Vitis vinifera]|uniref:non-specific serine/threonine protein kinase n=1 Tax=Vitis vinifera TaxID=29760 RepID=A0A438EYT9_VITVI|nr:L-type lectin-domain containing receptor kinase S.1 [Vitis vinifera]